jgi:transcriptional regulator with XRE-family HTH domain
MTLAKLARETGTSPGRLSEIERGLAVPSVPLLYRLAVALGLIEMAAMLEPYVQAERIKRGGTAAGTDQESQDDPAPEVPPDGSREPPA